MKKKDDKFYTEGIKYMGSKKSILPYIIKILGNIEGKKILDGFSGTTRVSQFFSNMGAIVHSNDLNIWGEVFGTCFLLGGKINKTQIKEKILHLNSLSPIEGYYTKTYGGRDIDGSSVQSDGKKRIRQYHNTMKLDSIRDEIENISENTVERNVLLTSLIIALDKIDSTIGHQSSYLRKRAKRSYKDVTLLLPTFAKYNEQHSVTSDDVFNIIEKNTYDIAYYDPPYGSANDKMPSSRVRYGLYYHIRDNIIKNDKIDTYGSVMKRVDCNYKTTYSVFEEYKKDEENVFIAQRAIKKLIKNTKSNQILFSYNTHSRVPIANIEGVIKELGFFYDIHYLNYKKNIMTGMSWTGEWNTLDQKENFEVLIHIRK